MTTCFRICRHVGDRTADRDHHHPPRGRTARCRVRHPLRGHLSFRPPHRQGRVGRGRVPDGARARDRRHRHRGRFGGHQVPGGRSRRRGLLRGFLSRVRPVPGRRGAVLHQSGNGRHLQRRGPRRPADPGRLQRRDRRRRELRVAHPRSVCRWTPRHRCYARASRCIRLCATGMRARASGWRSSAWADWATWGSSWRTRWARR